MSIDSQYGGWVRHSVIVGTDVVDWAFLRIDFWWAHALVFVWTGLFVVVLMVFVGVRLAGPNRAARSGWRTGLSVGFSTLVLVALILFGLRPIRDDYPLAVILSGLVLSGIAGAITANRAARPSHVE